MQSCDALLARLSDGRENRRLEQVYGTQTPAGLAAILDRTTQAVRRYAKRFPAEGTGPVALFSGPGRTELCGNHTDHQRGKVLAASVNLDMLAVAAPNGSDEVCILSEGYPELRVNLSDLAPQSREEGTSAALLRGVAAGIVRRNQRVGGFNACICSNVPAGSGLSSSAAYEVLLGVILNYFYCADALTAVEIAQIGQYAENVFFGKPCGLMDQMASAVGGAVAIDFAHPESPLVERLSYDFSASGHTLCIVDTHASHADLTGDYAAIPREMCAVAAVFGKDVLREVDEAAFYRRLAEVRQCTDDRSALRAIHFFTENHRVVQAADGLRSGDFAGFLSAVRSSGKSSAQNLQNLYAVAQSGRQGVPLALAVAEAALQGRGAARVHGGGFAGTIQAFVPNHLQSDFTAQMDAFLGAGACHTLSIRPEGGCFLL